MSYVLHLLIYLSIYGIVAMSLNLAISYCGLLTLAHASYFAIGSYVYALVTLRLGWDFLPALGLGVVVSAVLSLAVSIPAWKFRGDFFVMVSLAVQALMFSLFYNWTTTGAEPGTWQNLTNGPFGLSLVCGGICWLLVSSPWGRLLQVMRDDELAAKGFGKNTQLVKVQAFAIACGMAAVGGTIYAAYVSYVDPSTASWDESVLMTCMVLVGGVGNFRGPLVGAFLLLLIPEVLRFAMIPDAIAFGASGAITANLRLILYGVLLVVMMHVRPQGIAGDYRVD
jgi:branched-chain amino acid transport system permease protein